MSTNPPDDSPIVLNPGIGIPLADEDPSFSRVGPIIQVQDLKDEYLFGIPLQSQLTKQKLTDPILKKIIFKAIADAETMIKIPILKVNISDEPFDYKRADDIQFSTRRLSKWPVLQINSLQAQWPGRTDDQRTNFPTSWASVNADTGLFRIVPKSGTEVNVDIGFIGLHGRFSSNVEGWPNLWHISYVAGFEYDKVPHLVNDLVGTLAALRTLSLMAPILFPVNSISIGVDGLNKGVSGAGTQYLLQRSTELIAERDRLVFQLRSIYSTDLFFASF